MFDRMAAGFRAAGSCWEVLKSDKCLVVFPLLSGLSALLVLLSFAVPLALIKPQFLSALGDGQLDDARTSVAAYVVAFAFYFCNYFVIYFFNAALVHCALQHFRGEEAGPAEGIAAATARLPQLL